jgi:hypothetical protein
VILLKDLMMSHRLVIALVLTLPASVALFVPVAAQADTKDQDCAYQGQVVHAVQQARLQGVKEPDVATYIAGQSPEWPDKYDVVIGLTTPFVYQQKKRDLRKTDLGEMWRVSCLAQ